MLLKKIVIAEDDDSVAHMVSMALGDAGYLCIRAVDGAEALQFTTLHQPDLLVLDVMMPQMTGREVATALKSDLLLSRIPILMLTALGDVDNKVAGLDAGADDYMGKPFDLRELSARVRSLIRASKRERDRNGATELPGSGAIDEHIQQVLAGSEDRAVVQLGVQGFEELIAIRGHQEAIHFVKSFASFLKTKVCALEPSFLGHLGGGDFVVSCPAEDANPLMESVVQGYCDSLETWAPDYQLELKLVGAVVSTAGIPDESTLAERLAVTIRRSRKAADSNFAVFSESSP